jgi:tetratricopeptide (TPR) repeat protein
MGKGSAPASRELDEETYEELKLMCEEGDALAGQGRTEEALAAFREAWRLVPEPWQEVDAARWVLAAMGDMLFLLGRFEEARRVLSDALHSPDAVGNPFLHLRLGQCQLELGDEARAADELARAFLLEGRELFEGEDPRYLAFVLSKLAPPPGGA